MRTGRSEAVVLVCAGVVRKQTDLWTSYGVVDVAIAERRKGGLKQVMPWKQASRERDGSLRTDEVSVRLSDLDGDGKPEVSVLCRSYSAQTGPSRVWVGMEIGGKWRAAGVADSEYPFDLVRGPNGTRSWRGSYRIGGRSRRHNHEKWLDYYGVVRGRLIPIPQRFRRAYAAIARRLARDVRDDPDAELWVHLAMARRILGMRGESRRAASRALDLARRDRQESFRLMKSDDENDVWIIQQAKAILGTAAGSPASKP